MEDIYDTEEYQQYIEDCIRECQCCSQCWEVPCGGVMAGGMCDQMCMCDEEEYDNDI